PTPTFVGGSDLDVRLPPFPPSLRLQCAKRDRGVGKALSFLVEDGRTTEVAALIRFHSGDAVLSARVVEMLIEGFRVVACERLVNLHRPDQRAQIEVIV